MRQARPFQNPYHANAPESSLRQSFQDGLVLDHLNLAKSIAARYSAHTHDLDDVRQVAFMGLIKAARGYDEAKGVSFPAYAAPPLPVRLRGTCGTIAGWCVPRVLSRTCGARSSPGQKK